FLPPRPETSAWQLLLDQLEAEPGGIPVPDGLAVTRTYVGLHLHLPDEDVSAVVAELATVWKHRWRMRLTVSAAVLSDQIGVFIGGQVPDLARSLLLDLRYLGARQLEDVTRVARWRRESGDSGAVMVPADNLPYRPWGTANVE